MVHGVNEGFFFKSTKKGQRGEPFHTRGGKAASSKIRKARGEGKENHIPIVHAACSEKKK